MNSENQTEPIMLLTTSRSDGAHDAPYSPEVVLLISIAAGICSLVTVLGNAVVIISFLINKTLRNFSNCMILSLAFSDLTIGMFSMNVFTTYNVSKKWILGSAMCKAWLSVDYTASNASIMNLLVICVDRYLAITKPVKYKRWCTPAHAAVAIVFVWVVSFFMWVPAITLWDVASNNATLAEGECYIPFINDSPALSVATIVVAFYAPASLMCMLYQRVIYHINHRRSGIRSIIQASAKPATQKGSRLFKWKRFLSKEDDLTRASSSGSIPGVFPNSESRVDKSTRKKNMLLELSDGSSASTPSARSRLSNSEFLKIDDANEMKVSCSYFGKKKPSNAQLDSSKTTCQHSLWRQNPPLSSKAKSMSSGVTSPDQNSGLLSCESRGCRENNRYNREHRVTVLLKCILLCFILLWLPYSLIVIVTAVCDRCISPVVWNLSYWLCYLNSTVNPFCYGLCNENFRLTFKAILTTRWWTKERRKMLRTGRRTMALNRNILKK